jgi:hypothetical protein
MIPQIILGGEMNKVIYHTPQSKIEKALALVDQALNNEIGFCYKQVVRYPLDSGRELRQEMIYLKRERINPTTLPARCAVINRKLKAMREEEREHYLFDETAYRTLRSNYDKLTVALKLLCREGEVESYTLRPTGLLRVEYWTEYETTYIEEIEQNWTFTHDKVETVIPTGGNNICTGDLDLYKPSGIPAHGVKPKKYVGEWAGQGEHDPKTDNYKLHTQWINYHKDLVFAFYAKYENRQLRDMNTVDIYV